MDTTFTSHSLAEIYPSTSVDRESKRYRALKEKFQQTFGGTAGAKLTFIARSPGRVNLIGEHVDYSWYSVLPMALSDGDIVMAVGVLPETSADAQCTLHVANINSSKFPTRQFSFKSLADLTIDATKHEWTNYFLSGFKGVLNELKITKPRSMVCLIDGTVPSGAGVSSSSAFVCCSALVTMHANGKSLNKRQLTECAIKSERFVGVESGGMDQSCSILGDPTSALVISFYPQLDARPVRLPLALPNGDSFCFVIAHSGVTSDKHVTAPVCYNLRVAETRLASVYLAKWLVDNGQLPATTDWRSGIRVLRQVQEALYAKPGAKRESIAELKAMLALTEEAFEAGLKNGGYTMKQIAQFLGMSPEEVTKNYASQYPIRAEVFHLYRRSKHVFSESLRVHQFDAVCREGMDAMKAWTKLGQLMIESQISCRDDFMCSCPELDELTKLAVESGALGSRLTGAGWGGCTVSLVRQSTVQDFINTLKARYYTPNKKEPIVFVTSAGRGGCLVKMDGI